MTCASAILARRVRLPGLDRSRADIGSNDRPCEMRFRRIRAQTERCLHCSVGERNAVRSWIEVRVVLDRFIQGFSRLEQCRPHVSRIDIAVDDRLGLNVKLERVQVLSWPLFDFRLLLWRKLRLELSDNRLSQLALDCEQIGRGAIVSFGPYVRIGASVDYRTV